MLHVPPKQPPLQQVSAGAHGWPSGTHAVTQTPLVPHARPEQHGLAAEHGCPDGWHPVEQTPPMHELPGQHSLLFVHGLVSGVQHTKLVVSHIRLGRQSSLSSQYAPLLRMPKAVVQIPLLQ
jgi:hypothetical protein